MFAGVAGVLAVLHLLRIRPRRITVVTTLFWDQALERRKARRLLEQFRHPWTYALLLALCGLIVLALGRPQLRADRANQAHEVIVLDAGLSLQARDSGEKQTRLDLARAAAARRADELGGSDQVAVIAAAPQPRIVHSFQDARPLLARHLDLITAAAEPAALERAVSLARGLLVGRSRPAVTLITDRPCPEGLSTKDIRVIQVGQPQANAAVIGATFQPAASNPLRGQFTARIINQANQPRQLEVSIRRAGGAVLFNETRSVPASQPVDFSVLDLPADGDKLLVQIRANEALGTDDSAEFRLPARTPINVRVQGHIPAALRAGLGADPSVRLVEPGQGCDVLVIADGSPRPRRPALVLSDEPIASDEPIRAAGGHPLLTGLDFEESAVVGVADGAIKSGYALLSVGSQDVLTWPAEEEPQHATINVALWSDRFSITRRPAFAALLIRMTRKLAGWSDEPLSVPVRRTVEDPTWVAAPWRPATLVPADRQSADLGAAAAIQATPSSARRLAMSGFEWLLAGALVLCVVEAVLHLRGRIP